MNHLPEVPNNQDRVDLPSDARTSTSATGLIVVASQMETKASGMPLSRDRQQALGLFLRHIAAGERVAHRSAWLQSRLAPAPRAARFFSGQARREALHARLFDWFAARLGAPRLRLAAYPYAAFQTRIELAAHSKQFLTTVIATQVVLAALRDTLLSRLDSGLSHAGSGFTRLRRTIRRRRARESASGKELVAGMLHRGEIDESTLQMLARPFVQLAEAMIASTAAVSVHLAASPRAIAADFRGRLPAWASA